MIFIDTNYFLRLLVDDNVEQHRAAQQLFDRGAGGKVSLVTSVVVFFEVHSD